MPQDLKIIGKIEIPEPKTKEKCTCDYCKSVLNDSCGDPRVRVTTKYANGKVDVKHICEACNQLDMEEPGNIFEGYRHWDEMRYNGL